MDWWSRAADVAQVAGIAAGAVFSVWRIIKRVRTNDLAHLDKKIDQVHDDVKETKGLILRHLEWHSGRDK